MKTYDEQTFDEAAESVHNPPPSGVGGSLSLGQRVQSLRLPESAAGRSGSAKLAWFLCFVLAGTSGWLAYQLYGKPSDRADAQQAGAANDNPTVAAADVQQQRAAADSEIAHESKGYIIPTHQILVSPKVSGVVVELNIEEGQRVAEGDVLARIEDTDYKSDNDRANATLRLAQERLAELETGTRPDEISQARAELAEATVQFEKFAADLQRATDLYRRRVVSEAEFQDFQSKHDAQQRRVEKLNFALKLLDEGPRLERIRAARAEVSQAQADVAKAKWRLDNCTIRAPISGTILSKDAEEGNLVNPIAFSGSRSLCEMADLASLEVDLSIVERDISKVFKGQNCLIKAEAYPEREYHGVVSRLMPIADRAKGSVSVRVRLSVPADEEGVYLKPEMSARVTFLSDKAAATPSVPPAN
ncbi:MAG: efflux RND transporter periplasmic adaptor subunit [Pirellulales bacterium]